MKRRAHQKQHEMSLSRAQHKIWKVQRLTNSKVGSKKVEHMAETARERERFEWCNIVCSRMVDDKVWLKERLYSHDDKEHDRGGSVMHEQRMGAIRASFKKLERRELRGISTEEGK